jgi:uncharacterized protein YodC (DUF2158 family)
VNPTAKAAHRGPSIEERFCYRGDTVRLRTGGREMLVVQMSGESVLGEWVELDVIIEREWFDMKDLVLVSRG